MSIITSLHTVSGSVYHMSGGVCSVVREPGHLLGERETFHYSQAVGASDPFVWYGDRAIIENSADGGGSVLTSRIVKVERWDTTTGRMRRSYPVSA